MKTIGDAFLVEFSSALEATNCAVDVQRALSERNARVPSEEKMQIRVGIHVGEVVATDRDYFGNAVNIASRIESLAEPGGICLKSQVYDHVRGKTDLQMVKLEALGLKGVRQVEEVYKIDPFAG